MPIATIALGAALMILGIAGYVLTGSTHPTALIPAYFGFAFDLLGSFSIVFPRQRRHLMHAAAALGLLGTAGTAGGLINYIRWKTGGLMLTSDASNSAASKAIMCVLCLLFVALCIFSFVGARRKREAGFTASPQ